MNLNMNNIILAIILCWLGRRLLNGVGFIDIVDLIVWIWRFLGNPSTAWNYKRNKEQKKSHCKQYFGIIRSQHQLQFRTPPNEDNLISHTGPISLLDETHHRCAIPARINQYQYLILKNQVSIPISISIFQISEIDTDFNTNTPDLENQYRYQYQYLSFENSITIPILRILSFNINLDLNTEPLTENALWPN